MNAPNEEKLYADIVDAYEALGEALAALDESTGHTAARDPLVRAKVLARLMATSVPRGLGALLKREPTVRDELVAIAALVGRSGLLAEADLVGVLTTPERDAPRILDGSLAAAVKAVHAQRAAAAVERRREHEARVEERGKQEAAERARIRSGNTGEAVRS